MVPHPISLSIILGVQGSKTEWLIHSHMKIGPHTLELITGQACLSKLLDSRQDVTVCFFTLKDPQRGLSRQNRTALADTCTGHMCDPNHVIRVQSLVEKSPVG